jgi:hypothetical protein
MSVRIQLRRDSAANWSATNPILAQGEPGLNIDTGQIKIGDGTTAWNSLSYSMTGPAGPVADGGEIHPFLLMGA